MSKFYIDKTSYGRNDIDITPNDFRDGSEFGQYTKSIADEITAHPGATVRELLAVPCPNRDSEYWLGLALHELKSAGRIDERGVTFSRYYRREVNQ